MSDADVVSVLGECGLERTQLAWEGLQLSEVVGLRLTGFRCHPASDARPRDWPQRVGEVAGDNPALCCLRPGEWLSIGAADHGDEALRSGLVRIDRSHGFAAFGLSGPAAPWLLAQLGALDFTALAGIAGARLDQTRMGHVRALLLSRPAHTGVGPGFLLLVERGLARYLWERMLQAVPHALGQATPGGA